MKEINELAAQSKLTRRQLEQWVNHHCQQTGELAYLVTHRVVGNALVPQVEANQ